MLTFYQIQARAEIPQENRKIDRDPATAGDDFDENKFRLNFVRFGMAKLGPTQSGRNLIATTWIKSELSTAGVGR
jgi:hypothetical protein